jgi:hypothetical protein
MGTLEERRFSCAGSGISETQNSAGKFGGADSCGTQWRCAASAKPALLKFAVLPLALYAQDPTIVAELVQDIIPDIARVARSNGGGIVRHLKYESDGSVSGDYIGVLMHPDGEGAMKRLRGVARVKSLSMECKMPSPSPRALSPSCR